MEKVNINIATIDELKTIRFVGEKRSLLIIEGRPYRDLYELSKIKGFGKKTIDKIIAEGIATK